MLQSISTILGAMGAMYFPPLFGERAGDAAPLFSSPLCVKRKTQDTSRI